MKAKKHLTFNLLFGVMTAIFGVSILMAWPSPNASAEQPSLDSTLSTDTTAITHDVPVIAPTDSVGGGTDDLPPADEPGLLKRLWALIVGNKGAALAAFLALAEIVVRLTPTEKDNNLLRLLQSWLDKIVPNYRKGGGQFAAFTEKEDAPALAAVKPKK